MERYFDAGMVVIWLCPASVNAARDTFRHSAAYQRAAMSEVENVLAADGDQMAAGRRRLGAMPVVVLTSGNSAIDPSFSATENAALRKLQWRTQEGLAQLSDRPVHRLLPNASHFIPAKHPEAVVVAVNEARGMAGR